MSWFCILKYTKSHNQHFLYKAIPRRRHCVCRKENPTLSFLGLLWYLHGTGPEASQGRKRIKIFYFIWYTKNRLNCNILSQEAVPWINLELSVLTQCLFCCSVNTCVWLLDTRPYPKCSEQGQVLWLLKKPESIVHVVQGRNCAWVRTEVASNPLCFSTYQPLAPSTLHSQWIRPRTVAELSKGTLQSQPECKQHAQSERSNTMALNVRNSEIPTPTLDYFKIF